MKTRRVGATLRKRPCKNLVGSARFRTKAAQEGWNNNPAAGDFTVLDESAELPYESDPPRNNKKNL
jgi:hypothetical protein